jgi:hypothetical protein
MIAAVFAESPQIALATDITNSAIQSGKGILYLFRSIHRTDW